MTETPKTPTVEEQLTQLRSFISRRFDEISMEINATSQQVDMAEEGIIDKFVDILSVMRTISFSGDGSTPANTGFELEEAVKVAEDAANKIMDAASKISELVGQEPLDVDAVGAAVDQIYMACSFQDITGQRIRKALANISDIESRLSVALEKLGIKMEVVSGLQHAVSEDITAERSSQDDIDQLFD